MSNSPRVQMIDITCTYGSVRALDRVSLDFPPGQVHALAGENGAGKSTVLKILTGLVAPAAGHVRIGSAEYTHVAHSHAAGIRLIPQEPIVAPELSVMENIFLGRLPRRGALRIDWTLAHERSRTLLNRVGLAGMDPRRRAGELPVSQVQLLQVARAISDEGSIFLFDEPTSSLSPTETDRIFEVIRSLRAEGKVVVYVSHRLSELFAICDAVSVLRDGRLVGTRDMKAVTQDTLIQMMVGRAIAGTGRPAVSHGQNIGLDVGLPGARFSVKTGEIVGLAGLNGAGRTELLQTIFGIRRAPHGHVQVGGSNLKLGSPTASVAAGIALVPEDRKRDGLGLDLPVADNIALPNLNRIGPPGFVSRRRKRRLVVDVIARLSIKLRDASAPVRALSGGNQQKVVIGKWLAKRPLVLLLDEPTRGVDVASKAEIHRIIIALAAEGVSIVLASSEMPELLALSDRVLVMCEGQVSGEVCGESMNEEAILRLATPPAKAIRESAYAG